MGFIQGFIMGTLVGAIIVVVIMCALTMGSWQDDIAERMARLDNPKNVGKRIERKK